MSKQEPSLHPSSLGDPGYEFERIITETAVADSRVEPIERDLSGTDASEGQWLPQPEIMLDTWLSRMINDLALNIEQVSHNGLSIELLAAIYEKGALNSSELGRMGARKALALAMLAAANMCDVDPHSVRLAKNGESMINRLRHAASGKPSG